MDLIIIFLSKKTIFSYLIVKYFIFFIFSKVLKKKNQNFKYMTILFNLPIN
jgi:hypothetical protein